MTGFLAGFVVPFDPLKTAGLTAPYRVEIDGRRFDFAMDHCRMAAAGGEPDVTVTASAPRLVALSMAEMADYAGDPEAEVVGIYLLLGDDLPGQAILTFPLADGLFLVDALSSLASVVALLVLFWFGFETNHPMNAPVPEGKHELFLRARLFKAINRDDVLRLLFGALGVAAACGLWTTVLKPVAARYG